MSTNSVFCDMCKSVQEKLHAFECNIDEEAGTAQMVLDSVHRINLKHLSLFPSLSVRYRQDDRRYVLQTEVSEGTMQHNAMLVEYDRMASFYEIDDIGPLKRVIETVHENASARFHKMVRQGDVFIAVFVVNKSSSNEICFNARTLDNIANVSSAWIELHPDTSELRLCISLTPCSLLRPPRPKNNKRARDAENGDAAALLDSEDPHKRRRRVRFDDEGESQQKKAQRPQLLLAS